MPALKFHGGKWYLAKKIIELMPPRYSDDNPDGYLNYVEPYFGGGAVLFANDPEGISEVVNDYHGPLINFWRVLADEKLFGRLQRRVTATPFSESTYLDAMATIEVFVNRTPSDIDADKVSLAWAFFVVVRQSLAGRMGSFTAITRKRVRRGMNAEASAWLSAIDGLPAVHERLKRVVILGPEDALKVIASQDDERTFFYLDPPYLSETRAAPKVYKHESSYGHHVALLRLLRTIKGRFIISGYRSKLYDDYAFDNGWRRTDFELPNNAASGTEKRRMIECLWSNYH